MSGPIERSDAAISRALDRFLAAPEDDFEPDEADRVMAAEAKWEQYEDR